MPGLRLGTQKKDGRSKSNPQYEKSSILFKKDYITHYRDKIMVLGGRTNRERFPEVGFVGRIGV